MTVNGKLCVWDKGRIQWISKQPDEWCYVRRINVYLTAYNFKDTIATAVFHPIACHCNIALHANGVTN